MGEKTEAIYEKNEDRCYAWVTLSMKPRQSVMLGRFFHGRGRPLGCQVWVYGKGEVRG